MDLTVSGFPRRPGYVRVEQNVFSAAFVAQGALPVPLVRKILMQ